MGKHNGKARKTGKSVGAGLANRSQTRNRLHKEDGRHTTDIGNNDRPNMQSIIERNDLDEFMAMAELQGREFAGERGTEGTVLVVESSVTPLDLERASAEREEIEERHQDKLRIPRRPDWTHETTREQLDDMERTMFLEWRRDLATLEETERLCLTPFEKNLEVWRQLWRVLERSDCVVQVVDARDPLRYFSEDLIDYAETIDSCKRSFILLNKADLLSRDGRKEWARYFDAEGVDFAFWSARNATEEQKAAKAAAKVAEAGGLMLDEPSAATVVADFNDPDDDPEIRVLDIDQLVDRLESFASECVAAAAEDDPRRADPNHRLMVGLVGYPNVGKSSTINALYGSKKTSVAPTPGKTKHFQTLQLEGTNVSLCDCPGLVLPRFAASKAEMVAAGVVPIDRLTDVVPPVAEIVKRAGRKQICAVYGMPLPRPASHEDPNRPPRPMEVINALALTRGWTAGSGLPDETRAGRQLLKDFVDGKLCYREWPPDSPAEIIRRTPYDDAPDVVAEQQDEEGAEEEAADAEETTTGPNEAASSASGAADALNLDEGDLELLQSLSVSNKPKRAQHKFHKKAARSKGDRGQDKSTGADGVGAVMYGKKGGLVRVTGYS